MDDSAINMIPSYRTSSILYIIIMMKLPLLSLWERPNLTCEVTYKPHHRKIDRIPVSIVLMLRVAATSSEIVEKKSKFVADAKLSRIKMMMRMNTKNWTAPSEAMPVPSTVESMDNVKS
ncbi:hypothetical protein O6H91_14G036400 [Diphasiastrum complanatum]|uniref:Uncharacterized protein n=1 Tax=Diphasiastrum complanatum TaxID=34168 RepID=A0ACC2BN64_DIPCM|nr:hypothetical protein O6H91_14G036400 [Diphasiastrum complanatum]